MNRFLSVQNVKDKNKELHATLLVVLKNKQADKHTIPQRTTKADTDKSSMAL